jgi:hypothetical protein
MIFTHRRDQCSTDDGGAALPREFVMVDRRLMFLGSLSLLALRTPELVNAQQADESIRVRGVIKKFDGQTVTVQSADGKSLDLRVAADAVITRNEPSSLAAVKPGDYIASAAVKGDDGKLHSTDLRIFPEALRGLGDGQHPMQDQGKTMTNAAVSEVVAAPQGQILKVKFNDGTSELVVGPNVPITALVVVSSSDLKAGMTVLVLAIKAVDGTLAAKRILAQ